MATYALFVLPGYGHVNPTLALTQALVARGEQVIYYLTEEFRPAIEATGAEFRLYKGELWNVMDQMAWALKQAPDANTRGDIIAKITRESTKDIPKLLDQMADEHISAILYDRKAMIVGSFVSQILRVPAVQLAPASLVNKYSLPYFMEISAIGVQPSLQLPDLVNEELARLCDSYKLPHCTWQDLMEHEENLVIAFIPRTFQPGGEMFDKRFVFVGPSLPTQRRDSGNFPLEQLEKRPLLYISLGTAANKQPNFYNMCFDAFAQTDWQVVLSIGHRVDPATLKKPPANFLVVTHAPQLEVLAHADLCICHGGMNSTLESLWFGVPLLITPRMLEQEWTARRVQELGLGLMLNWRTLTAEQLRTAADQIAHSPSFHRCAQKIQKELSKAGGAQKAAESIMAYIKRDLSVSR